MKDLKKTLVMNGDYREKQSVILANGFIVSGRDFANASKLKPEMEVNMLVIT